MKGKSFKHRSGVQDRGQGCGVQGAPKRANAHARRQHAPPRNGYPIRGGAMRGCIWGQAQCGVKCHPRPGTRANACPRRPHDFSPCGSRLDSELCLSRIVRINPYEFLKRHFIEVSHVGYSPLRSAACGGGTMQRSKRLSLLPCVLARTSATRFALSFWARMTQG